MSPIKSSNERVGGRQMTRVSVLDVVPVPESRTPRGAIEDTVQLARLADRLGYHRFWVAEHHGNASFASTAPEILIGHIASQTERIRVGSGATLLPYYSPLKVAEVFQTLETMYPGRIDLGIGRGQGAEPPAAMALRSGNPPLSREQDEDQLLELLGFLAASFPDDHPYRSVLAAPPTPNPPEVWLLGTSLASAATAADLGLPYGFATFPKHESATDALHHYREAFGEGGWNSSPSSLIAVGAICAATEEEAVAIATERDELPAPASTDYPDWPSFLIGDVESVSRQLTDIVRQTQVDELMIVTIVHNHAARMRSYELLAEALNVSPVSGDSLRLTESVR